MIKEFFINCYQEVTRIILEVVTKCWDWLSSINIGVKGFSNPISRSCHRCCKSANSHEFLKFIADISFPQWMTMVFAILGIVMLCISVGIKTNPVRSRVFQKSCVVCFLLMAGFCANSELCWIVIAVLLVIMLLKFNAITQWLEVLGKEESEPTKKLKK